MLLLGWYLLSCHWRGISTTLFAGSNGKYAVRGGGWSVSDEQPGFTSEIAPLPVIAIGFIGIPPILTKLRLLIIILKS